jgi:hypothetical protein
MFIELVRNLVELVKAVAWPIAVLLIFWWYRRQIKTLLRRLSSMEVAGVRAEFDKRLAKAADVAAKLEKPPTEKVGTPAIPGPGDKMETQLEQLKKISPTAAIITAWAGFENEARNTLKEAGVDLPTYSYEELGRALSDKGVFSTAEMVLYNQLRHMRNLAVHNPGKVLSEEDAGQYILYVHTLMLALFRFKQP